MASRVPLGPTRALYAVACEWSRVPGASGRWKRMSCSPWSIFRKCSAGMSSATASANASNVVTTVNNGGAQRPATIAGLSSLVAAAYARARAGSTVETRSGYSAPIRSKGNDIRANVPRGRGTVAGMTRLLLVRHGESEWNAIGRWQGWADPPLSELGARQAAVAARSVGAVDAIVSSDLERARHTAEIVATELGIGPVVVDASLRERDAGPWTGMTRAEIEADWPGYLASGKRPDGYEEDEALLDRVAPVLQMLEAAGDVVLVVTHGGVIGAVERWLGATHQRTPNLGGRVVDVTAGVARLSEQLLLVDEHDVHVTAPPEV